MSNIKKGKKKSKNSISLNSFLEKKERINKFGEVFTSEKNVLDMLSLVENEIVRIDSKFLEQSCGEGVFLKEIIKKKIYFLLKRYKKNQSEFDKNLIIVISGLYGIDIREENVKICRQNLYETIKKIYLKNFKTLSEKLEKTLKVLLSKNILTGDSLQMKTNTGDYIEFFEWTPIDNTYISRRSFHYENLINSNNQKSFIPRENKIFSPIKFLEIGELNE